MSEKLLDVAVEEVVKSKNQEHRDFYENPDNIKCIKLFIKGTKDRAERRRLGDKVWLYDIVANKMNGAHR